MVTQTAEIYKPSFAVRSIVIFIIAMTSYLNKSTAQDDGYAIHSYPKNVLPGVNIYITIEDANVKRDNDVGRIYPINHSKNKIVTFRDAARTIKNGEFNTGNYYKNDIVLKNTSYQFDSTCIINNIAINDSKAISKPEGYEVPLTFKIYQRSSKAYHEIESSITHAGITMDEIADYEFIIKNQLSNTFRTYYRFHSQFYVHALIEIEGLKKIRVDLNANAMPDAAIDVNVKLDTIELILNHLKRRINVKSRYIPFFQAKLIYNLGIYEQMELKSKHDNNSPIPVLGDKMRIEILRYLEDELQARPNPLLQYHFAAYVNDDPQRSMELLKAACEKCDDDYLVKLAKQRMESIERTMLNK